MTQTYDKEKFLEAAQAAEAQRLAKLEEWNRKKRSLDKRARAHSFRGAQTNF